MVLPPVSLSFMKFQSIGNDFIIADLHRYQLAQANVLLEKLSLPETVRYLCNRRTGIGADCLLIITKSYDNNKADIVVYNADGSYARNCLNGVRTIAHYLHAYCSFDAEMTVGVGGGLKFFCTVVRVYPEKKSADVITQISGCKIIRPASVIVENKSLIQGCRISSALFLYESK